MARQLLQLTTIINYEWDYVGHNIFPVLITILFQIKLLKSELIKSERHFQYRKVASSRPVYYSIFYLFWGATNQDVLLTETCYYCYIQKSIKWWVHKGPCVFSSIFVNSQWLALFLQTPFKNVLKTLDGAFLLLWKCNFISKNWKNLTRIFEDPTFWIYFSNQNVGSSRILIRFFQFLLG